MAEFDNPSDAVAAARRVYEEGYRRIDAFSPYPVEELSEAIGVHKTHMPLIVLIGGILGGTLGYLMQFYLLAIDYPLNVGGKPYHSWPAFIPITFECTVLGAALFAVFGMFALSSTCRTSGSPRATASSCSSNRPTPSSTASGRPSSYAPSGLVR
jgi:hypothetical protein